MRRFLIFFTAVFLWLNSFCRAANPVPRVPHLSIVGMFDMEEYIPIHEQEKVDFINSLMKRVWNEDFGKFIELFYKHYFKIPIKRNLEFESMAFTEDTIWSTELLMKYLYLSPTKNCLNFFRCWVDFFKDFQCEKTKKEIILESFKEFVCRFLIENSKNSYITSQFLKERTEIICELYDLEDKKTLLS